MRTYYLQHMGIDCWVPRSVLSATKELALLEQQASRQSSCSTMLQKHPVMCRVACVIQDDERLHDASRRLLHHMLRSVGLLPEHVVYVIYQEQAQGMKQLSDVRADVILALGEAANQMHAQDTPVIASKYHPADLLQSPLDKKSMYKDLLRMCLLLQNQ